MGSPSVHESESLADAMAMMDSHVPLTHRERKLIMTSLYDLAFRQGADQGRQAGVEAVQNVIKATMDAIDPETDAGLYAIAVLRELLPAETPVVGEYADTTQVIREKLAVEAQRQRNNGK